MLGHLHDTPVTLDAMQGYAFKSLMVLGHCVWPILAATMVSGLLAGGVQARFRTASEALEVNWGKLNPVEGLKRVFSMKSAVPTMVGAFKLSVVIALTYGVIKNVLSDPIFHSSVSVARIAGFMADSAFKIVLRVAAALLVLAAGDYGYQIWRTSRDMMMTKQEVKEESKSTEGNPTHIAIALRYDRKTMKAPKIVAKGTRLNALRIKEIAKEHQVPIIENKPLARLMFKYGRVGGEIPAQLYAAVAEILAWVYRVNAYRYYREQSQ